VAAAGEDADKRLVAYVVLQRDQTADADALARHLGVRLPRHMIPASFVILPALPLTRNGKVDRRALPAPDVPGPVMRGRRPEAWTPTERRVARVWRDVLDLPDIGPDDNFFTLGGHSLLAVRLFGLLEDEFGVPLPLSQLFEHGTIRSLARMLDGSRPIPPWTPLVPIRPAGSEKPLFLVHGVGGEVLSFTNLALRLPAAVPVYGIQAPGPGSDHGMPHEISALAERYADLVASVEPDGPYYLGGFSSGAVTALEVAAVLRRRGRPVALLLLIDGGLPASVRPHARIRHTPASILRQMALWVVDDALATPVEHWWPRIGSKVRAMASRVNSTLTRRSANGHSGVDMRHRLGMWKFPGQYRALLAERLEAFERHVPSPYEGDIALVRSRTTRLFGPRPENLDEAWRALSRGSFSVTYVPGSHTSMLEVPRVDELARAVAACLDRARAAAERP
jgi:thioesterase domain-containing protein/acyl carrier protein